MAFNVVKCKNISECSQYVVDEATKVCGDLTRAAIIIVPDRFSLTVEQLLFKGKTGAMFNTHVASFTKLAYMVSGGNLNVLNKTNSVMLLWQAIDAVSDKLLCFKKSCKSFSFAEKMFNTINQLTSGNTKIEELTESDKFKDIKLIYEKYQQLLENNGLKDSGGVLKFLINALPTWQPLKNANVFVLGFSNLTRQRMEVVNQLILNAGSVTIAVQDDLDKSMMLDLIGLEKNFKTSEIENKINAKVAAVSAKDIFSECDFVVKNILHLVKTNNLRFRDVNVVIGDYKALSSIYSQNFKNNGITAYFDEGENLCNTSHFKLMQSLLLFVFTGETEHLIKMLKNPIVEMDREKKFQIELDILKRKIVKPFVYEDVILKLKKCKTAGDFCNALLSLNIELPAALTEILESAKIYLGEVAMDCLQFFKMLQSVCSSVSIETVPDVTDSVRVYDSANANILKNKVVFLVNMVQGIFPAVNADTDIITKQDIKLCKQNISPDVELNNLRNYQAGVNVLNSATDKVFVSFPLSALSGEANNPSFLYNKVKKQFGTTSFNDFVFNNQTKDLAEKTLQQLTDFGMFNDNAATVIAALEAENREQSGGEESGLVDVNKNQTFSASQIETFLTCPARHFYQYLLRIKPLEVAGITRLDTGNIIHYFCERLVENKNIEKTIKETLEKYKEIFALPENRVIVEGLKKELLIIGKHILESLANVKEVIPEYEFNGMVSDIPFKGKIDRIDVLENGEVCRLIDYKTGNSVSLTASDVYVGSKIQLIIYSIVLKGVREVAGVYYMKISGAKVKEGEERYKMIGVEGGELELAKSYVERLVSNAVSEIKNGENSASVISEKTCEYCDYASVCFERKVRCGNKTPRLKWEGLIND